AQAGRRPVPGRMPAAPAGLPGRGAGRAGARPGSSRARAQGHVEQPVGRAGATRGPSTGAGRAPERLGERHGLSAEIGRRARRSETPAYVILLTARDLKSDVVAGLRSGANDYITKPFDRDELRARVRVGRTVVELQESLAVRVRELEAALAQVKQLQGLLPI